jgi:hypothetical protein|tara:strand:+ start:348 stop:479 length:132 start_codon:yes stop_codon:yes gene_type:complete
MVGIVVSAGVRTVLPPTLLDEQDPRLRLLWSFHVFKGVQEFPP